jgi:D-alanyl-D-alanine carboxypeptidase
VHPGNIVAGSTTEAAARRRVAIDGAFALKEGSMFRIASRLALPVSLAAALTAGCATSATAGRSDASSRSELRAARILDGHRARREFPGAVLAMRDPSGASFTVTSGAAEPTTGAPIDASTPWIIGSTTKTFLAVVVLQLAQERKLDLDATVERFYPDLPAASRITTRQLLQHTSGVAEYLHTEAVEGDARREWRARELIAVAVARGPVAEPGAGHRYSNTNYLLLGEIVEKLTSRPWYAEVRSRVIEPLGLRHTGYAGEPSAPRLGTGHVIAGGKFVDATSRWHPSVGGAAGAMYSTAADLLAFTVALFEGDLLDAKRSAEMRTFVRGDDIGYVRYAYGLGLERYTVNDLTLLGHMGNASAHSSFIGYDPTSRAAVAVQINAANPGPAAIMAAEVLGEVTGKDASAPPMPSASAGYTFFPYRTLERSGTGERIGKVRVTSQQVSASRPIVANEGRTRLDVSVAYQRLQFDYRDMTHPLDSAQAVSATAFLRQRLTDSWGLILVAAPGYADDFKGRASLDAVTLTFVGAGSYRFSDRLEVGLGVAVQNVFGEPLPMPVAAVEWTIADGLWLKSILPINAELTWLPIDRVGLRAALLASGGNYHGSESVYGVNNPQLNYSAVAADLGARWFILPSLHLTIHGGYTLYRRFEFSEGRHRVPGGEYELANGMVYGIDLGVGR